MCKPAEPHKAHQRKGVYECSKCAHQALTLPGGKEVGREPPFGDVLCFQNSSQVSNKKVVKKNVRALH